MNNTNNHIRSFGMSGLQIVDDLNKIENKYGIELGHTKSTGQKEADESFSQFELSMRQEAANMATCYQIFYCLEQSMRKIISETLSDAEKSPWWDSTRIPEEIKKEVKSRIKNEEDSGITPRSDNHIDYTTFGELSQIINKNWDVFGAVFTSQRAISRIMHDLNALRNPIAHCCPLASDEITKLDIAVKALFRQM